MILQFHLCSGSHQFFLGCKTKFTAEQQLPCLCARAPCLPRADGGIRDKQRSEGQWSAGTAHLQVPCHELHWPQDDRSSFKQNQTFHFPPSRNLSSALIFWDVFPLRGISYFCYNLLQLVTKATWITAEHTAFAFWKKPPGTASWFPFMDLECRESGKFQ